MRPCRVCPAQMILYWICFLFSHSQCHFSLIYCSYHQTVYIARSGYVKHIAKIMTKLGSKVGVPSSNFSVAGFVDSCQVPPKHTRIHHHPQRIKRWPPAKVLSVNVMQVSLQLLSFVFMPWFPSNNTSDCTEVLWLDCMHWPNKRARWPDSSINVWVWHNGLYLNSYLFSH